MKAVIFDYNGVLVDDLELHEDAYLELAKRHNAELTREGIKKIMYKPAKTKVEIITGEKDSSTITEILKEKERIYIEIARDVLFPSARDVINRLSEKYILTIITNTSKKQLEAVFPSDLLGKFKIILTYEDIEKPKPAPDSLLKVMGELGVNESESCYVGDSVSDMQAAKNAGVLVIGIPTGYYSKEQLRESGADVILNSLSELENVVGSR